MHFAQASMWVTLGSGLSYLPRSHKQFAFVAARAPGPASGPPWANIPAGLSVGRFAPACVGVTASATKDQWIFRPPGVLRIRCARLRQPAWFSICAATWLRAQTWQAIFRSWARAVLVAGHQDIAPTPHASTDKQQHGTFTNIWSKEASPLDRDISAKRRAAPGGTSTEQI